MSWHLYFGWPLEDKHWRVQRHTKYVLIRPLIWDDSGSEGVILCDPSFIEYAGFTTVPFKYISELNGESSNLVLIINLETLH